jgi:1-acyl-sn-glycerol-3-phosphate acyltransferase
MLHQAWYLLGRSAVAGYARSLLHMDISRQAPLPAGPKIIAANHPTTTDPFYITLLTSEPVHVLITEMCFHIPVVGQSLRLAGHVPVIDGSGHTALDSAALLLRSGQTVVVFPEGALSPADGSVHKSHTGVARMALMAGVPVIPVGISLDWRRIWHVDATVRDKTEAARFYLRGPYAMTIGEPMRFAGDVEDRVYVRSVSERIMQHVALLAHESARRLLTSPAPDCGVHYPVRVPNTGQELLAAGR